MSDCYSGGGLALQMSLDLKETGVNVCQELEMNELKS